MKPASRNLYQRVQSSDDSEDSSPPHEKIPDDTPEQPKPSPPNGNSSEDDPKLEDDLKELTASQAHHTSNALERAKKTVMIEIKGKSPPGKDGVFALNRDMKCRSLIEATIATTNVAHSEHDFQRVKYTPSLVDYGSTMSAHPRSMLYKERLVDTRKGLLPVTLQAKNTLDRVKRLQERAGMMEAKDRFQERRERCSAAFSQNRSGYTNVPRFKGAGFESMLAEKPILDMDSKCEGVLKISDRSFSENGEKNVVYSLRGVFIL